MKSQAKRLMHRLLMLMLQQWLGQKIGALSYKSLCVQDFC
ncbi:hypothetical protein GLYMA_05G098250v4 [Glycine max]|nr:hypothetical protein GLYMA_05G098250v4 [Glycine max]KAH1133635.1 hypothetical protein GYH30_012166 [Glycine max]